MDLFEYFPNFKVLVCRLCRYAIPPKAIKAHLERKHRGDHHDLQGKDGPALTSRKLLSRPDIVLLDPAEETLAPPKPDSDALPFLEVHVGFQCKKCPKILCDTKSIVKHLRKIHKISRRGPGRPSISSQRIEEDWTKVACQRFFTSGHQSTYFKVLSREESKRRQTDATQDSGRRGQNGTPEGLTEADLVHAEISLQLSTYQKGLKATREVVNKDVDKTEISPWLQLTRWSTYLDGHSLCDVAKLADLPQKTSEPLLSIICDSIDRIVEQAHRSVCEDRINVFDQMRINSFLQRPRAADKPLMVKLQESTYKAYKSVWKRLICFAHRTSQTHNSVQLRHRITAAQITRYDQLLTSAETLIHIDNDETPDRD
jgi:hypothetical protein